MSNARMNQPTMFICLACDDNYAPHAATLIASILVNKEVDDSLSFVILGDNLTDLVKDKFVQMSEKWSVPISIITCSDDAFIGLPKWHDKYSAYYRLALHRLLPASISKVLYLDCDMVVTTSLSSLYNTDISEKYAAVVAESKFSSFTTHKCPYFNTGMLLLNLDKFRADDMEKKAIDLGLRRFHDIAFPDQDILNELFFGHVVYMPLQ
ncbi:MAG: glycosyltransferase family 8 protein [Thermoguttaceae bacterium]